MPDYVSKAGGVGLAYVLTVDDLGLLATGSFDSGSLLVTASFANPFLSFSKGDGTQFFINLQTLVPTNASTASFVTASNVYGPYGANSVISASVAISASIASTASFVTASNVFGPFGRNSVLSASWARFAVTASYVPPGGAAASPPEYGIQYNSGGFFAGNSAFLFNYLSRSFQHGRDVIAAGLGSHVQGRNSIASGVYGYAQGFLVTASGESSHAQGDRSTAIGDSSHAEGSQTLAFAIADHAEGFNTATGLYGYATRDKFQGTSPNSVTILSEYGDVTSVFSQDTIILVRDDSSNLSFIQVVSNSSFDVGQNETTVSIYKTTFSTSTPTSLFVLNNQKPTNYQNLGPSRWINLNNDASASFKHAEGVNSISLGVTAHSEGSQSIAFGRGSHAEGELTRAYATSSHSEGVKTFTGTFAYRAQASSDSKLLLHSDYANLTAFFSVGQQIVTYNVALGAYVKSTIFSVDLDGTNTNLIVEEGNLPLDGGGESLLFTTSAEKPYGADYFVANQGSHSEGNLTLALGSFSHTEGSGSVAFGTASHAEGINTVAIGEASHTEGIGTFASGTYSHAEGSSSQAIGQYSHAEGLGTIAYANGQLAAGQYNKNFNDRDLFVIGNGADESNRSDIVNVSLTTVNITGSAVISSSLNVIGTSSVTGSNNITGSWTLRGTGRVTGSLMVSNSFTVIGTSTVTGSNSITGSWNLVGTGRVSGSLIVSNSLQVIGISTTTGSVFVTGSQTSVGSFILTGSAFVTGGINLVGNQTITGSLFVDGNITAQQYIVSSSVIYVTESNFSGSHVFGNTLDDTHQFTGSILLTGSANFVGPFIADQVFITGSLSGSFVGTGSGNFNGIFTGSLFGTSSWSSQALTASFVTSSNVWGPFGSNSIMSASHAVSASYALSSSYSVSSSYAVTSSFASSASFVTSSNVYGPFNADSILSASHAVTASFIDGGTF